MRCAAVRFGEFLIKGGTPQSTRYNNAPWRSQQQLRPNERTKRQSGDEEDKEDAALGRVIYNKPPFCQAQAEHGRSGVLVPGYEQNRVRPQVLQMVNSDPRHGIFPSRCRRARTGGRGRRRGGCGRGEGDGRNDRVRSRCCAGNEDGVSDVELGTGSKKRETLGDSGTDTGQFGTQHNESKVIKTHGNRARHPCPICTQGRWGESREGRTVVRYKVLCTIQSTGVPRYEVHLYVCTLVESIEDRAGESAPPPGCTIRAMCIANDSMPAGRLSCQHRHQHQY